MTRRAGCGDAGENSIGPLGSWCDVTPSASSCSSVCTNLGSRGDARPVPVATCAVQNRTQVLPREVPRQRAAAPLFTAPIK